jgi:hypothetical protein
LQEEKRQQRPLDRRADAGRDAAEDDLDRS